MSYEGFEQHLCTNGHYWEEDSSYAETDNVCPFCKTPSVWYNCVDETNCEGVGYIPMQALLVTPAIKQTCNLGHEHVITPEVYRIPSNDEMDKMRTIRDKNGALSLLEWT